MTQITGKIFPMYDKTGQNRRFPETVIEAVLGLSSYLQNQFSSLANIYMPIGGIYQSQTGQEFVYRATPNTIKAKSFTLDRIQGKSLAWNQLNNLQDRIAACTTAQTTIANSNPEMTFYASHKYLFIAELTTLTANDKIWLWGGDRSYTVGLKSKELWKIISIPTIDKPGRTNSFTVVANFGGSGVAGNAGYQNLITIDLTLLYGSEIDGMTDADILAKFESEYPGYHDYSAGKLISNDAKQLETVGRNVWDEEWEVGTISTTTGENVADNSKIRSKNYIPVFGGVTYYAACVGSYTGVIQFIEYDADKNFIKESGKIIGNEYTPSSSTAYIRFFLQSSYGTTYNHDICFNLSDTSFNGQYEPYRKSTLPLNLDDFWVKDGQGNQVHITGGLKSAGSVRDEIVGNKYIKRVGSVDMGSLSWSLSSADNHIFRVPLSEIPNVKPAPTNDDLVKAISARYTQKAYAPLAQSDNMCFSISNTASDRAVFINHAYSDTSTFKSEMSGVMFYYELATPEEYDLVEPLIYTMKSGTTEARISPNEDGLSSPFCCDMTYSASDNNDADNAQYAATAGRLLNTHKIWGKDFNGTQDVSGEMSGVTSINSLINISNGNVGIGKTPSVALDVNGQISGTQLISTVTSSAPLVVSSSELVSNLNVEKVGGKTLAEILASDITGNAKTATNAKSESKDDQEFMFRKTNVEWDAKSGVVKKIKGKTLAWNQLVNQFAIPVISGDSAHLTATKEVDGRIKIVLSAPVSSLTQITFANPITAFYKAGHRYFLSLRQSDNLTSYLTYSGGNGVWWQRTPSSLATLSMIWSVTTITDAIFTIYVGAALPAGTYYIYPQVVDLTLAGLDEVSTVADFDALYPNPLPYNPGVLISNDADAVETTGVNQWDEEWEVGTFNNATGAPLSNASEIRSKNFIPVIGGQTYYGYYGGSGNLFAWMYDANKNYIGASTQVLITNTTFVIPSNVRFIRIATYLANTTTYNHNICINLSNAAINGQYFPHSKRTLQLGLNSFKVRDAQGNVTTVNGLKSAGSVYDEIDFARKKYIKRVGSVDLGTVTWYISSTNTEYYTQPHLNNKISNGTIACINSKYAKVVTQADKAMSVLTTNGGEYRVRDSAYFNGGSTIVVPASTFKEDMSGVMMNYELATYEEYDLVDPIPSVYPCDQYGTERIISPESTTPSAPFIADLQYGAKSDDVAKELIDTRATVQPLLDAFEYDSTNEAWRLKGNFYADGFVSAYGTNESEALQALKDWVTENFEPKQS